MDALCLCVLISRVSGNRAEGGAVLFTSSGDQIKGKYMLDVCNA
jgi:hypothetical protein